MPTKEDYLRDGFIVCKEQRDAETRNPRAKHMQAAAPTLAVTAHWGRPTQKSLNEFFSTVNPLADVFDERHPKNNSENALVVKYTILPNGLMVLGREGASSRKHDNLAPSSLILRYLADDPRIQDSCFTEAAAIRANAVAAGNLYLKSMSDGNVRIVGVGITSGHYRFGENANTFVLAYLKHICPGLLDTNPYLMGTPFRPAADPDRALNLTTASTFQDWLTTAGETPEGICFSITSGQLSALQSKSSAEPAYVGRPRLTADIGGGFGGGAGGGSGSGYPWPSSGLGRPRLSGQRRRERMASMRARHHAGQMAARLGGSDLLTGPNLTTPPSSPQRNSKAQRRSPLSPNRANRLPNSPTKSNRFRLHARQLQLATGHLDASPPPTKQNKFEAVTP